MVHTKPKFSRKARGLAVGLGATLVTGFAGFAANASVPLTGNVSNARGQALDVIIADQDLSDVLGAAVAENDGGDDIAVVELLDLAPLEQAGPSLGPLDLLGDNGFLALDALNQYAEAAGDGSSHAAAGAVSDIGEIELPTNLAAEGAGGSLTIGTDDLGLGDLLELRIGLGAIASTATLPAGGEPEGTFELADPTVDVGGSLIDDVAGQITEALAPVTDQLGTVGGLLGVDTDIENPLDAGMLAVTEEDLLGAAGVESLTDLEPGTDLVPFLADAIVAALTGVVDDLIAQVSELVDELKSSPTFGTVCAPPLLPPNPACGVLDTVVDTVTETLQGVLDTVIETVLATLDDTLSTLLALPVGTETVGEDGSFSLTALSAIVSPDDVLGQVDLATSAVGPNQAALE